MAGGIGAKLTDRAVKAFVAKTERGKKLADGGGLHLFITPAGGATWRIKYRIDGKEKIYSIGPYDNTFQAIAQEWLAMKQKEWSTTHFTKSARAFERDLYLALGKLPIASITPAIVAKAIEDINKRDVLETAKTVFRQQHNQTLVGRIALEYADIPVFAIRLCRFTEAKQLHQCSCDQFDRRLPLLQSSKFNPYTPDILRLVADDECACGPVVLGGIDIHRHVAVFFAAPALDHLRRLRTAQQLVFDKQIQCAGRPIVGFVRAKQFCLRAR